MNEKSTFPYAIEEYVYMPTITAHPHTDCLNRSASNWKIFKLFNSLMTILIRYNVFDPQQLCQGRDGLRCQVWKVIVEDTLTLCTTPGLLRTKAFHL